MFDALRDILAYAYKATEVMEKKAHDFHEEREKHMEAFREKVKDAKGDIQDRIREQREQMQEHMNSHLQHAAKDSGLATKDEIDELRQMIVELGQKVDKLATE